MGLPTEVAPYFCGARRPEKDGEVRPIAVGEILWRLTSKCAAAVASKAANILSPIQLGVGVRNGWEALVHTLHTPPIPQRLSFTFPTNLRSQV